jgi:hypothetical protein
MPIKKNFLPICFAIILSIGCKEKFEPPVIQQGLSALVVDGFLNNSSDTTFIHLSRTKKLQEGIANSQEKGAQLFVEDAAANVLYYFQELADSGTYIVPGMSLNTGEKYRLRITTSNGKQYLSDELTVIKTPPIDSISLEHTSKGITLSVNTHDPQNATRYYRWEYAETWQYHARYFSSIIFENGALRDRGPDEYVYECWRTQRSKQLLLASSTKLSEDIIYHNPLRYFDQDGVELSEKYYIFLRQYALSKETYEYLQNLKKITEQTGSIFDMQPSEVTGNIHALNNPGELVLGYLTASTAEFKKIYITNDQVQPWNYLPACSIFKIPVDEIGSVSHGEITPLSRYNSAFDFKGINATAPSCGDCTVLGGIITKPDFWQ